MVKNFRVRGLVQAIDLKGLAESNDRPSTTDTLGKYIQHFRSVVGVSTGIKSLQKVDCPGKAKAMRNISNAFSDNLIGHRYNQVSVLHIAQTPLVFTLQIIIYSNQTYYKGMVVLDL